MQIRWSGQGRACSTEGRVNTSPRLLASRAAQALVFFLLSGGDERTIARSGRRLMWPKPARIMALI